MEVNIDINLEKAVEDRLTKVRDRSALLDSMQDEMNQLHNLREEVGSSIHPKDVIQITSCDNFYVAFSDGFVASAYREMIGVWPELKSNLPNQVQAISRFVKTGKKQREEKPLREIYQVLHYIHEKNPEYFEKVSSF